MSDVIFVTHAEVVIDPAVPVPEWGLTADGRARHERFAADAVLNDVAAVFSSTERKAVEGARAVTDARDMPLTQLESLGENDRSATGYLPPEAFWPVVDQFFAAPETSIHGWETAKDAQARVVSGVKAASQAAPPQGDVLIVSHGGVGALLRCHLQRRTITKDAGQPHAGGGCWFRFSRDMAGPPTEWSVI